MSRLQPGRLAGEFVVIVVGVLVALTLLTPIDFVARGEPLDTMVEATLFMAVGGNRFDVPVTDWTYQEMVGNAELGPIGDPPLRSSVVQYSSSAHAYAERAGEARALLRSPIYRSFARTSALRNETHATREAVTAARLLEPEAGEYVEGLVTYVTQRQFLREEWQTLARETLTLLEAR